MLQPYRLCARCIPEVACLNLALLERALNLSWRDHGILILGDQIFHDTALVVQDGGLRCLAEHSLSE